MFDRIEWFRRTRQFASPPGQPLIVRARAEGTDGWLFLMEDKGRAVALSSWYTLSFRPVFTDDAVDGTKYALLVAVARRLRKRLASVHAEPVTAADAAIICKAFDRARWVAQARPSTANWTVRTEGITFEEYWSARPGELRSTVKRKASKFAVETKIFTSFDGMAWADYEMIYAASWKPDEGAPEFLRDMALAEGAAGTLRLGIASIGGEPVAAQLWTVENGHAIIHKLAHAASANDQSPGSILSAAMFEYVIDTDRVALVDFGTGDDAYKADWMDTRTQLFSVDLFNPLRPAGLWGACRAWLSALVGWRPGR